MKLLNSGKVRRCTGATIHCRSKLPRNMRLNWLRFGENFEVEWVWGGCCVLRITATTFKVIWTKTVDSYEGNRFFFPLKVGWKATFFPWVWKGGRNKGLVVMTYGTMCMWGHHTELHKKARAVTTLSIKFCRPFVFLLHFGILLRLWRWVGSLPFSLRLVRCSEAGQRPWPDWVRLRTTTSKQAMRRSAGVI